MADARYVIDIAATMTGDETAAQLDDLTRTMTGAGVQADFFERAARDVGVALDEARVATAAANAALSDGASHLTALEREASRAGKAYERAFHRGKDTPEMAEAAHKAVAAVEEYVGELRQLEVAAASAARAESKLAAQSKHVATMSRHVDARLGSATSRLSTFRGALGDVGGPLGELGERVLYPVQGFTDLREKFGTARAAGVVFAVGAVAVAAAVAAVAVAAVAGVAAITAWGVSLASARQEAAWTLEAAAAMDPAIAAVAGSFGDIAARTGQSEEALAGLARQLSDAHVAAGDMPAALEAVAMAETALGKGGSSSLITSLREGKRTVGELAAEVDDKLGGIVARRLSGLDALMAKVKRNFADLFDDLDLAPLEDALRSLASLFDADTAAGETFGDAVQGIMQGVVDWAAEAYYKIEAFWLGFLIGMTKLEIALGPAQRALDQLGLGFGSAPEDDLDGAADAGERLAGVVGNLIIALKALGFVWDVMTYIPDQIERGLLGFIEMMGTIEWAALGSAIIDGIHEGLVSAGAAVLKFIADLAGDAIDVAKSILGIASPSRVFRGIGENTAEGFAEGVEGGTADAHTAMATMAEPTPAVTRAADNAATATGGTAAPRGGVSLSGVTFNFHGVDGAEGAVAQFRDTLIRVLEGEALAVGGAAT